MIFLPEFFYLKRLITITIAKQSKANRINVIKFKTKQPQKLRESLFPFSRNRNKIDNFF